MSTAAIPSRYKDFASYPYTTYFDYNAVHLLCLLVTDFRGYTPEVFVGQEIRQSVFTQEQYRDFSRQLARETGLLKTWLEEGHFSSESGSCGYELEAWITDKQLDPAPLNGEMLSRVNDPLVVPELSTFNFEINSQPQQLGPDMFGAMQRELTQRWQRCNEAARAIGANIVHIGILPTLRDNMLTMGNISPLQRYYALNREILQSREGTPLSINIEGIEEHLQLTHRDVMTEAATTSLQIHLQVSPQQAVRFFNAAQILSAPMVAVCANSPFLFGKLLWEETRIPLFEQAVSAPAFYDKPGHIVDRVTFGTQYAENSLLELFEQNQKAFPILLPVTGDESRLDALRLHNGTVWRWNRPLIGFGDDGKPHLRLEHRVAAAGPSAPDVIANVMFFYGLIHALAAASPAPEQQLPFEHALANFYQAARWGLSAKVYWLDGREHTLKSLIEDQLLPATDHALQELGISPADIRYYLHGIIAARLHSGQTGAQWQKAFVARYGRDFHALMRCYHDNQQRHIPVHEWPV